MVIKRDPTGKKGFDQNERLISLDSTEAGTSIQSLSSCNQISPNSFTSKSSWNRFAEPTQTLLFLDWDDTLFPTTELLDRLGMKAKGSMQKAEVPHITDMAGEKASLVKEWQESLQRFLTVACENSSGVRIITNARRPWIEDSIEQYAPNLKPLFSQVNGPKVIYAREVLREHRGVKKLRPISSSNPVKYALPEDRDKATLISEEMTSSKFEAMRREASRFYKSYPGQTWKNILSFGDINYEHDAVQEVGLRRRVAFPERLRIKSILLPSEPKLTESSLRLDFLRLMMPSFVAFDGDFFADLQESIDPMWTVSKVLCLPQLNELDFPEHAWGEGDAPEEEEVQEALVNLATFLHSLDT
eukprot:CAMPEP_0197669456 /NCGR_PEP_ID=MMETSP1338-20131121/72023_1 /TAXON_ID=43686 ORGANISM="Pelagodinium beii, Strain RCC1491" /NCGR_SAMPLE_ID=MMETSP1338 /ASSEMBLY_ACC=CAM_ASM_000754 /LENGTH=357 /DNA_ID=CAMNT_0043249021 /DNA_START=53 /DNA_END=1126 /DNA_ORIENTATION=+